MSNTGVANAARRAVLDAHLAIRITNARITNACITNACIAKAKL